MILLSIEGECMASEKMQASNTTRQCVARTVAEKLKALEEWKNSGVGPGKAAKMLGYPKASLITWRKNEDRLREAASTCRDRRTEGAGRRPGSAQFEEKIVAHVKNMHRRSGSLVYRRDIISYCQAVIPGFNTMSNNALNMWLTRFMRRNRLLAHSQPCLEVDKCVVACVNQVVADTVDSDVKDAALMIIELKTAPPKAMSRRARRRDNLLLEWGYANVENDHAGTHLKVYMEMKDIDSLMGNNWVRDQVVTYYLKRYIQPSPEIYIFSPPVFSNIFEQQRIPPQNPAMFGNIINTFDWSRYRFVIMPICENKHWSLLIIEDPPPRAGTTIYHIDSIPGYHDTKAMAAVMMKYFAMKSSSRTHPQAKLLVSVPTVPTQENSFDCALFVLYYADKVCDYIIRERPTTLRIAIQGIASGCKPSTCSQLRTRLSQQIDKDTKEYATGSHISL